MTGPSAWRATDETCPDCHDAKLLARSSPYYVEQSAAPFSLDTQWRCSDPELLRNLRQLDRRQ